MPAYYNEHDSLAAARLRTLISKGLIADGDVDERDIQDVAPTETPSSRKRLPRSSKPISTAKSSCEDDDIFA